MTHPPHTNPPVMANGQPNPTGTGRYCPPRVCYCGGPGPDPLPGACPSWTPLPDHIHHPTPRGNARQARSWGDRTDPTWIDTL